VWAIQQIGIRAVLAPSFGSIFEANALRNGLVPVRLPVQEIEAMMQVAVNAEFAVDVKDELVILPDGGSLPFALDPFGKSCLLEGVDAVEVGLSMLKGIEAYEANTARERPWEQHIDWDIVENES
jgi:3-isopropylmalate/(R)-2-methylmalate dehydratase small subunit